MGLAILTKREVRALCAVTQSSCILSPLSKGSSEPGTWSAEARPWAPFPSLLFPAGPEASLRVDPGPIFPAPGERRCKEGVLRLEPGWEVLGGRVPHEWGTRGPGDAMRKAQNELVWEEVSEYKAKARGASPAEHCWGVRTGGKRAGGVLLGARQAFRLSPPLVAPTVCFRLLAGIQSSGVPPFPLPVCAHTLCWERVA